MKNIFHKIKPKKKYQPNNLNELWLVLNKGNNNCTMDTSLIQFEETIIEHWLKQTQPKIIHYKNISEHKFNFNHNAIDLISKMVDDLSFYVETLYDIIKNNSFSIQSPLSGKKISSTISFASHTKIFIRYYDKCAKEVFYLVQDHQFIAGIYFPIRNIYIKYSGNPTQYVNWLKKLFVSKTDRIINKVCSCDNVAIKLIMSWGRPWHYFYNFGTAADILRRSNILKYCDFIYFIGGDFLKMNSAYPQMRSYEYMAYKDCELDSKNMILSCGVKFETISSKENESFGRYIMAQIDNIPNNQLVYRIDSINKNTLIIWIGVTSQKRIWLEQEEGILLIINYLINTKMKFHIVFDGWTNPVNPTSNDKQETERDKELINKIINRLGTPIEYSILAGVDSLNKLKIAKKCDFYFTNFAAGSIHVSRFAKLYGLSHLNSKMPRNQHLHYNNVEIDQKLIEDKPNVGESAHQISYSLPADVALSEFDNFFNSKSIQNIISSKNK